MKDLLEYYIARATTDEERAAREDIVDSYLRASIISAGMQYEMAIEQMMAARKAVEDAAIKQQKENVIELVQPNSIS